MKVYPGMIIIHEVVPLLGIKMKWMTEITQCMEKKRFVDEQRVGAIQDVASSTYY